MLERGYEVHGTVREGAHETLSPEIGISSCDLGNAAEINRIVSALRPQFIVHLAAISHVAYSDVSEIYQSNIVGTRNLLEAAANSSLLSRILIVSSANVYGNATEGILEESSPVSPANDYAVSKLAAEFLAKTYLKKLPITITRPFNYTGVGQSTSFLIPKIVDAARRGQARLKMGNLDVSRDFSDVRGIADAYVRLLEAPEAAGETVNVCSGRIYSLREILALIASMSGAEWQIEVNPALVRANEVCVLRGSNSKIEGIIGPLNIPPLEETLKWMLNAAD